MQKWLRSPLLCTGPYRGSMPLKWDCIVDDLDGILGTGKDDVGDKSAQQFIFGGFCQRART